MNLKFLLKQLICIFLFFLIILSSSHLKFCFASIVSDNDGFAFVTKKEFEDLKSILNSQINNYENSIDSKIDGAIANYLAGITLNTSDIVTLPYASWGKVTAMNYLPTVTYQYPNLNLTKMLFYLGHSADSTYNEDYWTYANLLYVRPKNAKDTRLLCDAGVESDTMPDYVCWEGQAIDYSDSITVNRITGSSKPESKDGYCGNNRDCINGEMWLIHTFRFETGYYEDRNANANTIWNPEIYYKSNVSDDYSGSRDDGMKYTQDASFNTLLNSDVNDETLKYQHIIHYNNIENIILSDKNWKNTIRNNPDSLKTTDNLLNDENLTIKAFYSITTGSAGGGAGYSPGRNGFDGYCTGDYGGSVEKNIPTVGLLNKTYESNKIYQTKEQFTQMVDRQNFADINRTLQEGFVCFAVKGGDEVIWEPTFIDCKTDGIDTNFELNVKLSTSPFTEGDANAPGGEVIKSKNQIQDYLVTSGGKCTFNWIAERDQIIYCKWWPADVTIESTKWEATLDLTQCGTYNRK